MLTYPEGLPLPLREGYGFAPVSPITRTAMASGRAMQRRRFKSVPTVASVTWLMTSPQAVFFQAWFDEAINSGVNWFECPLRTPLGLEKYRARFVDIYSGPELVGVDHWRFTAQLELFTIPLFAPGWVTTAPDYMLQPNIIDVAINREWPNA